MSGEEYSIDDRAQLFFVAPYWTGVVATGDQPESRLEALEALQEKLNAQSKKSEPWKIQRFEKPRTLRLRKGGQLWRSFEFEAPFIGELEALIGADHFGGIFSRVTYFDYGIGCVEVSIGIKNLNENNIETIDENLSRLKLRLVDELVAGIPHAEIDFMEIDKIISSELSSTARGVENRFRPKLGKHAGGGAAELMCGPVSRNILLIDSGGGAIPRFNVTLDQIKRLANSFLNESKANDGLNGSRCIPVSHEGFEGAVALLRRDTAACSRVDQQVRESADFKNICAGESGEVYRTKLLWSMAHMYWSAIFIASEGFFSIIAFHGNKNRYNYKKVESTLSNMEHYQKIVSMIKFEAQPAKIIVEGEDRIRYEAIWRAYNADDLMQSLAQIQVTAEAFLISLRDRMQKLMQTRLSRLFSIFALLTLVSVLADVILLYDVNFELDSKLRMTLLGLGSLTLIGAAATAYILLTYIGRFLSRRK